MNPKASILIVDDEEFIRRILVRIISRQGYVISEATNGVEALEKLKDTRYDFVITDISMPQMDGLELLAEIKKLHPQTIVILITAYSGRYSNDDVLEAGADGFISKPFKSDEIAGTLQKQYEQHIQKKINPEKS